MTPKEFENDYENYIKTGGVIGASIAMIATNFLLDAPLTNILTNKMTAHMNLSDKCDEKGSEAEPMLPTPNSEGRQLMCISTPAARPLSQEKSAMAKLNNCGPLCSRRSLCTHC